MSQIPFADEYTAMDELDEAELTSQTTTPSPSEWDGEGDSEDDDNGMFLSATFYTGVDGQLYVMEAYYSADTQMWTVEDIEKPTGVIVHEKLLGLNGGLQFAPRIHPPGASEVDVFLYQIIQRLRRRLTTEELMNVVHLSPSPKLFLFEDHETGNMEEYLQLQNWPQFVITKRRK